MKYRVTMVVLPDDGVSSVDIICRGNATQREIPTVCVAGDLPLPVFEFSVDNSECCEYPTPCGCKVVAGGVE